MNTDEKDVMKKGAITLLDILGWKGIWQREKDPITKLKTIIEIANGNIDFLKDKEMIRDVENRLRTLDVEVKSISDTLAIVSYSDDPNLALEFHSFLASIITARSIQLGIPVRGATCYGSFITTDNIMVGPAVDEVASWYECTDWIGVIQTPSAFFETNLDKFLFPNKPLIKYSAPLKKGGSFDTYCANWSTPWRSFKWDRNSLLDVFKEMGPITPEISNKYVNALRFYDWCVNNKKSVK
jgi:hypothetical protein